MITLNPELYTLNPEPYTPKLTYTMYLSNLQGSSMECSDEIERLTGARCATGNPVPPTGLGLGFGVLGFRVRGLGF